MKYKVISLDCKFHLVELANSKVWETLSDSTPTEIILAMYERCRKYNANAKAGLI